jgi:hypothetical protein
VILAAGVQGADSLTTKAEAYDRALEYTGFEYAKYNRPENKTERVEQVVLKDSTTPFIGDKLDGVEAWRVTFDSVFLDLSGWMPAVIQNQIPKTFDVYLNAETGQFLKAISRYERSDPDMGGEPPAEMAEKQLGGGVYTGLVDDVPPVSMLQAMDEAWAASPVTARQLIIWLVLHSHSTWKDRPTWIVLGRGTPPMDPIGGSHGREIPVWERNRKRCGVDASTGQFLFADNRPSVIPPDSTENSE